MWRWTLLLVAAWLAGTLSGVAGFGGAVLMLPALAFSLGGRASVPILTIAQLLGNLSRAAFGWREIRWRPVLIFSAGAVPASLLGARAFVEMSPASIQRWVGVVLLVVVALRHTALGTRRVGQRLLFPAGALVGLLSSIAGSAGPLGAAVFLNLGLPPQAYVSSEAATAVLIHLAKSLVYGRYAAMTADDLLRGLGLGAAMVLGSWTGRKIIERIPRKRFDSLVEAALVVAALALLA